MLISLTPNILLFLITLTLLTPKLKYNLSKPSFFKKNIKETVIIFQLILIFFQFITNTIKFFFSKGIISFISLISKLFF